MSGYSSPSHDRSRGGFGRLLMTPALALALAVCGPQAMALQQGNSSDQPRQTSSSQNQQTSQNRQSRQNSSGQGDGQNQQTMEWIYIEDLFGPDYLLLIEGKGQESGRQDQKSKTIQGTLEKAKLVNFKNLKHDHVVAEIKTDSGDTMTVDLGPEASLEAPLKRGQQLTIKGETGRINGKKALFATSVRSQGNSFQIQRGGNTDLTRQNTSNLGLPTNQNQGGRQQAQGGSSQHDGSYGGSQGQSESSDQQQSKTVSGTIADTRTVNFRGIDGQHLLVRMTPKGSGSDQPIVVDLGKASQFRSHNVSLNKGDQLTVTGVKGRINGNEAMFADSVRSMGKNISISRSNQNSLEAGDRAQTAGGRSNPDSQQKGSDSGGSR